MSMHEQRDSAAEMPTASPLPFPHSLPLPLPLHGGTVRLLSERDAVTGSAGGPQHTEHAVGVQRPGLRRTRFLTAIPAIER